MELLITIPKLLRLLKPHKRMERVRRGGLTQNLINSIYSLEYNMEVMEVNFVKAKWV